ncbi:MAG: enoyl-CoA hydratase/isomerase family protein [Deltaproteobacteria bacterium]|nr:enoyl-CoA hydratase/isomerase family protein [Deltaproteobacteria bacterium]
MSSFQTIEYEVENGVAWVRLNRPEKLNSFNSVMGQELQRIWTDLRSDDSVGAAILTGAGDKAFCTGIDRMEAMGGDAKPPRLASDMIHLDDPGEFLGPKANGLWKPVVAAVNGIACGGAFYMLGEVDVIIAAEHATFFDPHVTYGMVASFETIHMAQKLPFGELLRMQLLGAHERLSAQRAFDIGLVTEVCPAAELDERARWIAETIAARPRAAVQATLRAAWSTRDLPRSQALAQGGSFLALGWSPENIAEGQRFFESGGRVEWRKR